MQDCRNRRLSMTWASLSLANCGLAAFASESTVIDHFNWFWDYLPIFQCVKQSQAVRPAGEECFCCAHGRISRFRTAVRFKFACSWSVLSTRHLRSNLVSFIFFMASFTQFVGGMLEGRDWHRCAMEWGRPAWGWRLVDVQPEQWGSSAAVLHGKYCGPLAGKNWLGCHRRHSSQDRRSLEVSRPMFNSVTYARHVVLKLSIFFWPPSQSVSQLHCAYEYDMHLTIFDFVSAKKNGPNS